MSSQAPIDPQTARHLSHLLAVAQRDLRLPSVAAGIVRGGGLVWSDAVGTVDGRAGGATVDADTQYRMGSITKTFVAVAVMRLRDAGRLNLSDRFEDHVPGTRLGGATIEQLLSHGAGVQAETNGPWWERTPGVSWDELANSPVGQRSRAGRRFHYSNLGYAALGELVARAHGIGWFEVVKRDLLDPLGMRRTTTRPSGTAAYGLARRRRQATLRRLPPVCRSLDRDPLLHQDQRQRHRGRLVLRPPGRRMEPRRQARSAAR